MDPQQIDPRELLQRLQAAEDRAKAAEEARKAAEERATSSASQMEAFTQNYAKETRPSFDEVKEVIMKLNPSAEECIKFMEKFSAEPTYAYAWKNIHAMASELKKSQASIEDYAKQTEQYKKEAEQAQSTVQTLKASAHAGKSTTSQHFAPAVIGKRGLEADEENQSTQALRASAQKACTEDAQLAKKFPYANPELVQWGRQLQSEAGMTAGVRTHGGGTLMKPVDPEMAKLYGL